MITKNRVYINYFDTISSAGFSADELLSNICDQRECITLDKTFIKDRAVAIGKIDTTIGLNTLLLERLELLLRRLKLKDYSQTLLVIGSSVGGMSETEDIYFMDKNYKNIDYKKHPIGAVAHFLKGHYSFYDDVSFSTACTSSANALGYAKEVLQKSLYKNALVVGIDALSFTTVRGFSSLGVLSSKPCTPFSTSRDGMNVAEGLGILFLETYARDNAVEFLGAGYSLDAHHMTQPHPEGLGAIKAMQNALSDAKLKADDIDYINAHGTGTIANDSSESMAIETLFGSDVAISSTKSYTGHTLGAAGAIEAIVSAMAIQKQILPPNKKLVDTEFSNLNYIKEPKEVKIRYVMSNSFAFGGNNTSLIFGALQ